MANYSEVKGRIFLLKIDSKMPFMKAIGFMVCIALTILALIVGCAFLANVAIEKLGMPIVFYLVLAYFLFNFINVIAGKINARYTEETGDFTPALFSLGFLHRLVSVRQREKLIRAWLSRFGPGSSTAYFSAELARSLFLANLVFIHLNFGEYSHFFEGLRLFGYELWLLANAVSLGWLGEVFKGPAVHSGAGIAHYALYALQLAVVAGFAALVLNVLSAVRSQTSLYVGNYTGLQVFLTTRVRRGVNTARIFDLGLLDDPHLLQERELSAEVLATRSNALVSRLYEGLYGPPQPQQQIEPAK